MGTPSEIRSALRREESWWTADPTRVERRFLSFFEEPDEPDLVPFVDPWAVIDLILERLTLFDEFDSSDGEPLPVGTVVAIGAPPSRRQPDLEAHGRIRPATEADETRRVLGVTITADPHRVASSGVHIVRADSTLAPGEWAWIGDEPGTLSAAERGWWVLERIDEDHVRALIRYPEES